MTVKYAERLYLAWKLAMLPAGDSIDTMEAEVAEDLLTLIRVWEEHEASRTRQFWIKILGVEKK